MGGNDGVSEGAFDGVTVGILERNGLEDGFVTGLFEVMIDGFVGGKKEGNADNLL